MTPGTAPAQARGAATIRRADLTTVPNLVSLARIVGVAAAVLLYFAGYPRITVILGTVACLTDHLDGYLARRLNQETALGAMLDQAADSFTTAIALAMLVVAGGFPFVFLLIFLGREFWVATVRRYAALGNVEIPSHLFGKLATAIIYWALLLMAVTLMLDISASTAALLRPVALVSMGVRACAELHRRLALYARAGGEDGMIPSQVARGRGDVLLCPGPVMLSPGVKRALSQSQIGHRDRSFSDLVARLRRNCGTLLGAGSEHSVLFVTGPATSGIEAVCATLFPAGGTVVVPVNGTFGARIVEILKVHGIACTPIDSGFGQPFDLSLIEAALADQSSGGRPVFVAMTHHETSCGLVNPVSAVCELARRHGARTFVDATSSAGVEDLDVTRDRIDACVTSSGKCLHGAPGIALVCVRREWLAARGDSEPRSFLAGPAPLPRSARGELPDAIHARCPDLPRAGPGRRGTARAGRGGRATPSIPAPAGAAGARAGEPRPAAVAASGGQRGMLDPHGRRSRSARFRRALPHAA